MKITKNERSVTFISEYANEDQQIISCYSELSYHGFGLVLTTFHVSHIDTDNETKELTKKAVEFETSKHNKVWGEFAIKENFAYISTELPIDIKKDDMITNIVHDVLSSNAFICLLPCHFYFYLHQGTTKVSDEVVLFKLFDQKCIQKEISLINSFISTIEDQSKSNPCFNLLEISPKSFCIDANVLIGDEKINIELSFLNKKLLIFMTKPKRKEYFKILYTNIDDLNELIEKISHLTRKHLMSSLYVPFLKSVKEYFNELIVTLRVDSFCRIPKNDDLPKKLFKEYKRFLTIEEIELNMRQWSKSNDVTEVKYLKNHYFACIIKTIEDLYLGINIDQHHRINIFVEKTEETLVDKISSQ